MENEEQVFKNIQTITNLGIQKTFLINHSLNNESLLETAWNYKSMFPTLWVGVNLLGVPTLKAIQTDFKTIDGLWCDQAINSLTAIEHRTFKGQFFGSLAFKYQSQPTDLEWACKDSKKAYDVSTTSGPRTGQEADLNKIKLIRNYLGDHHPMAIASGVSESNISNYTGIVDYLLVASSITEDGEIINPSKLEKLIKLL